jgi:hypothetical protein
MAAHAPYVNQLPQGTKEEDTLKDTTGVARLRVSAR